MRGFVRCGASANPPVTVTIDSPTDRDQAHPADGMMFAGSVDATACKSGGVAENCAGAELHTEAYSHLYDSDLEQLADRIDERLRGAA